MEGNIFAAHGVNTAVSGGSAVPASFATDNSEVADITTVLGAYTATTLYSFTSLPFFQTGASPALTGAIDLNANNAFFDNVAYKGAFGTAASAEWNFTAGWLEWDPINADYFVEE